MKKNKIYIFLFNFLTLITYFFSQNAYANFIASGETLSTSNYEIRSLDLTGEVEDARDVTFNNDGTKMFTVDNGPRKVIEYNLSTPYNISTAVIGNDFFVSENTNPFKVKFNNNGSKMFILGRVQKKIYEYSLSSSFDLSLIHI